MLSYECDTFGLDTNFSYKGKEGGEEKAVSPLSSKDIVEAFVRGA